MFLTVRRVYIGVYYNPTVSLKELKFVELYKK